MSGFKLSAAQCIAMREAKINEDGSYELVTAKGQTLTALRERGIIMATDNRLTVRGFMYRTAVVSDDAPISKGRMIRVPDENGQEDDVYTTPQGEHVRADWEDDEPIKGFVGVRQAPVGWHDVEHIHAEGCRDITREMRRFGQRERDTYTYTSDMSLADIIATNWADIASDTHADTDSEDAWLDMIGNFNSDMRVMPCAVEIMRRGVCTAGALSLSEGGYVSILESEPAEETFYCPNCQSRILCGFEDMHSTPCYACDSDGHASCQHPIEEDTRSAYERVVNPDGIDSSMSGQYDDYDYAADEIKFAAMEAEMADTISEPITQEAHFSITIDGITVDLGYHTFTIPTGSEKSLADMYGERHGEWKRPGAADWSSVITVTDIYTY